MKTFEYMITDPSGIHARPAGLLAKETSKFSSKITIEAKGKAADAKKIFAVMGMSILNGDKIAIHAEGNDEEEAIQAIGDFIKKTL